MSMKTSVHVLLQCPMSIQTLPSNINEFLQSHCTAVLCERETFSDAIMDRKCEILNFIRDERLDVVKELHEKELQLLDITTLSFGQDLSLLMDNYRSLLDNYCLFLSDILNMVASLDEMEDFLLRNW